MFGRRVPIQARTGASGEGTGIPHGEGRGTRYPDQGGAGRALADPLEVAMFSGIVHFSSINQPLRLSPVPVVTAAVTGRAWIRYRNMYPARPWPSLVCCQHVFTCRILDSEMISIT